jgi:hypothetical protein
LAAIAPSNYYPPPWSCGGFSSQQPKNTLSDVPPGSPAHFFFLLAAIRCGSSSALTLLGYSEPHLPDRIVILVLAAIAMPWLAREKRALVVGDGSAALRADAAESMLCAFCRLSPWSD